MEPVGGERGRGDQQLEGRVGVAAGTKEIDEVIDKVALAEEYSLFKLLEKRE